MLVWIPFKHVGLAQDDRSKTHRTLNISCIFPLQPGVARQPPSPEENIFQVEEYGDIRRRDEAEDAAGFARSPQRSANTLQLQT